MPTIQEIAKLCKVSTSTVSRVLNNHPYVSEKIRREVLRVIEEMNYTPHFLARGLRTNSSKLLAVSVPKADHPFFAGLIKGISLQALEFNYKVCVFQTFYCKENELELMKLLQNREVDGIILGALENMWDDIAPYLKRGPILMCNEFHETAPVPILCYNEFESGYTAVRHLIERGYRDIGFCFDTANSAAQNMRKKGYLAALSDHNLPYREEWIFDGAFSILDGIRIMDRIHHLPEKKPTALFSGSDQVAAGLIKQAVNLGYSVPGDLAVIGYDNQPICRVTTPTITSIDTPVEQLGRQAVTRLLACLTEELPLKREVTLFPTALVVREST
ncbi:LacI family DNA-binding transcriptional regulator [Paenibacillus chitinolyticus]|uniref:LacI family DNA-binding transcriptional regulator n=1 Tax=Paenibacillus chitinolyticus TaxID=79263 RepID=UPI001C46D574|nr:LacI family DNA-binding transcriptional regulator [Paenibacillus chitinolyticus]MBV6715219.1 LacI family transcriptional regulator [Paenibacillus chitinolyticus]